MRKLIDKDALIELLAKMQAVCNSHAELVGISKVWQQVKDMPTIDAVPVIRCKDCKYRYTECGMGFCEKIDNLFYHYEDEDPIDADFYCSWAERKEE